MSYPPVSNSPFFTHPVDFVALRNRWGQTSLHALDQALVPLLVLLGSHAGIVPVWSCQSHPATADSPAENEFHFVVGVTEEGAAFLSALHERWWHWFHYEDYALTNSSLPIVRLDAPQVKLCMPILTAGPKMTGQSERLGWRGWKWSATFVNRRYHTQEKIDEHVQWLMTNIQALMDEQSNR